MRIRRQTTTAILLALLSLVWLDGAFARGDETASAKKHDAVIAEDSGRRDLFADELRKRQLFEERVAICRDTNSSNQSTQTNRLGQVEFARDAGTELVFLGLAELRVKFLPLQDAAAPEPPGLSLPPSRSPPAC